jgi:deoxyribodipyrimidine photo-lyase
LPRNSISFELRGGENPALNRLKYYFNDSNLIATYKETRNGMVGTDYSSRLSPWLALGNISARTVFDYIVQYENDVVSNESTYWLIFELLWRDFFQLQLQIHGDAFFKRKGIQGKEIRFRQNDKVFWKWANGETGDELVDANMRELNTTGWMSNRGRQNVASYLIHDLGTDWRWGAAYLESQLIDYDPASNYGNWMYIAGVGNDPRPFRKFNTQGQAERYDEDGSYRSLWLK